MPFSRNDAMFVGTVLTGLFYGIYLVIFGIFISLKYRERSWKSPVTITTIVIFILSTLFFAMFVPQEYYRILPDTDWDLQAGWSINHANSTLYSIIDFLCEMILIYRCWIIWGRRYWVVVLPTLMALASLGGELYLVGLLTSIGVTGIPNGDQLHILLSVGNTSFGLSLAVNAIVTILIVSRIWIASRPVRKALPGETQSFQIIVSMLIESGLFIFATQLIYLVLFSLQHPAYWLVSGPTVQIYGITPTVLAIRVRVNKPYGPNHFKASSIQFAHGTSKSHTTAATHISMTSSSVPSTMAMSAPGYNVNLDSDSSSSPVNDVEKIV